jgi:hypothetical protein
MPRESARTRRQIACAAVALRHREGARHIIADEHHWRDHPIRDGRGHRFRLARCDHRRYQQPGRHRDGGSGYATGHRSWWSSNVAVVVSRVQAPPRPHPRPPQARTQARRRSTRRRAHRPELSIMSSELRDAGELSIMSPELPIDWKEQIFAAGM